MTKLAIVLAVAVAISVGASSAAAHHSAVQFDFTKSVSITGVVKKFQAINPHMRLVLQVKDTKGDREIEFEGHSTNNMYRAGYRANMIKVGDTITVSVAPHRDGTEGGYVTSAVTASGARFGPRSGAELARERERAETR
jgi:hypothetical protein